MAAVGDEPKQWCSDVVGAQELLEMASQWHENGENGDMDPA